MSEEISEEEEEEKRKARGISHANERLSSVCLRIVTLYYCTTIFTKKNPKILSFHVRSASLELGARIHLCFLSLSLSLSLHLSSTSAQETGETNSGESGKIVRSGTKKRMEKMTSDFDLHNLSLSLPFYCSFPPPPPPSPNLKKPLFLSSQQK